MNPPARDRASRLSLFAQAAFYLGAVIWTGALVRLLPFKTTYWLEGLFLLAALAVTLISLARTLPAQNVLSAAGLIALMASIVEIISAKSGIPFGQRVFTEDFGPRIFGLLPWPVPLIWVIAVLDARGVARLILRPWRKLSKYGFWVIGLTCVLAVVFDLALEPFASATSRYWIWWTSKSMPAWYSTPFFSFIGWLVVTLLILAFVTPWLINKNPSRSSPPDYQPLLIWLGLNLVFAAGCAGEHLWKAVIFDVIAATVVTTFAIRGARW